MKEGILLALELREAAATPSHQSFLASALEGLWRRQFGGKVIAINGTLWPFSLSLLQPSQYLLCPVTSSTVLSQK